MDRTPDDAHETTGFVARNQAAYEASLAEARALPDSALVHITTSMETVVEAVNTKWPALLALRPDVLRRCPHVDIADYDALPDRLRALRYSHALYATAIDAPRSCAPEVKALRGVQERLSTHVKLMVLRGRMPAMAERALKFTPSHRQTVTNVFNTIVHIRAHWSAIANDFGMTMAELSAIEAEAERLDARIGLVADRRANTRKAADIRERMFALLLGSLLQVERAVEFLFSDPSERAKYLPAIYAACGSWAKRKKTSEPVPAQLPELAVPVEQRATTQLTAVPTNASEGVRVPATEASVACCQPRLDETTKLQPGK